MKSAKWVILLFGILALVQLMVPAKMILDSETVISEGSLFLFKLRPIDPNDPFRGKYMTLSFEADEFTIDTCATVGRYNAYVYLKSDAEGFATIQSVESSTTLRGTDYVKASVYCDYYGPVNKLKKPKLHVQYSFNRYYMNELNISSAEDKVRELLRDTTVTIYGEVFIKSGHARIQSIKSNGEDILDLIQE